MNNGFQVSAPKEQSCGMVIKNVAAHVFFLSCSIGIRSTNIRKAENEQCNKGPLLCLKKMLTNQKRS